MLNSDIDWNSFNFADVGNNRVNRLNDRYIKYLFANPQHKHLLIDFVNDALLWEGEKSIKDLNLISGELVQDSANMKLSVLDLSVQLTDGATIDIEIQIINRHDFKKRTPFYWAMRHVRKLKSGSTYLEVKPTLFISVLAFNLFAEEKYYRNTYSIRNDLSGNLLCEDMQLIYLELPKFRNLVSTPRTGLERWLLYLSNEEAEKMANIAEFDPALATALSLEGKYWANEQEKERYFAEQKRLLDELSNEKTFIYLLNEAAIKGKEEGEHAGRIKTACAMLADAMSLDLISKFTGLPMEEIEALHGHTLLPPEESPQS